MVSTPKKNQQKRQLSYLNETLDDFVVGNDNNMGATENEKLEQQTNSPNDELEMFVGCSSQKQVKEKKIDDKLEGR